MLVPLLTLCAVHSAALAPADPDPPPQGAAPVASAEEALTPPGEEAPTPPGEKEREPSEAPTLDNAPPALPTIQETPASSEGALDAAASPAVSTPEPSAPSSDAAPGKERARIFVLDFVSKDQPAAAAIATALSAAALSNTDRFTLLSGRDVRGMLEVEATKQELGCAEDQASCFAEVAGALGATLLVVGEVTQLGTGLLLHLTLLDTERAKAIARVTVRAKDAEDLPGRIEPAARNLVRSLTGEEEVAIPPVNLAIGMDDTRSLRGAYLTAAGAIGGGIMSAGGIGLFLYLNNRIKEPDDIFNVQLYGFPLAGLIVMPGAAALAAVGSDLALLKSWSIARPLLVGAITGAGFFASSAFMIYPVSFSEEALPSGHLWVPAIGMLATTAATGAVAGAAYIIGVGLFGAEAAGDEAGVEIE